MPRKDQVLRELSELNPEEQTEIAFFLLRHAVWPPWPIPFWLTGIDSTPDVCGGEPCITRTRIPVWLLEQMRRLGARESDILCSYPTLRAADLINAWAYVEWHKSEIDKQILENEKA